MFRFMTPKSRISRKINMFSLPPLNAKSIILFDTLIRSKWGNSALSAEKSNVKIALTSALQLILSMFPGTGLEFSVTQNCLNEE